jgi:NADH dehydrogenase FAD-containing subunit
LAALQQLRPSTSARRSRFSLLACLVLQDTSQWRLDMNPTGDSRAYDIVILGAGYAGLMAALRLGRKRQRLRTALISASDRFLERVRLQESIVTEVVPRISSIAAFLAGSNVEFISGTITSLDADRRAVRVATGERELEILFDEAIYALGSRVDVDGVPGATEHAYRLEASEGPRSPSALRARLRENAGRPIRVITVGGAETAIEVAGEIKTAWPNAEMTMISSSRCGDIKGPRVERAIRAELVRLGVTMIDGETVTVVRSDRLVTAAGRSLPFDICVWSGGLRSAPIASDAGIATDIQGRVWVDPNLRSISHAHIVAIGDAAHPVAPTGAPYRLSAFVAITTGAYAADLVLARETKRQLDPFSFSTFGQGIAIGRSGVGFPSYPDDRQRWFILTGNTARVVRNFFVWFISYALKLERRMPGFFFWPGRRRVSWNQANQAIRLVPTKQKVQTI